MNELTPASKHHLVEGIEARFNSEELVLLCSDLGVDIESLANGTKTLKILSLIEHCRRHEMIDSLLKLLKRHRPLFAWSAVIVNGNGHGHGMKSELTDIQTEKCSSPVIHVDNSPFEVCIPFIQSLINHLKNIETAINPSAELGSQILDCVADIYMARSVFVVSLREDEVYIPIRGSAIEQTDIDEARELIQSFATATHRKNRINHSRVETMIGSIKAGIEKFCLISLVAMPEEYEELTTAEFLVMVGVPNSSNYLGELFAVVLNALYAATNKLTVLVLPKLEESILDDLKRCYFSLPNSLAKARLRLIHSSLAQLTFHFQPIIRLHPKDMYIASWEALARVKNAATDEAPKELLSSIELWGGEFSALFDSFVLREAVTTYRHKLRNVRGIRRAEDLKDLSVNVYPQSLAQPVYHETVKQILEEGLIPCEKLILELSERSTFPMGVYTSPGRNSAQEIRERIEHFVQRFQIDFSIDDFGSGQNQIDKLNLLPVKFLKVDRSVLFEKHAEETLEFILKTTRKSSLIIPKVIVEGFEEGIGQKLVLSDLYRLGVRYIQCYLSGMPKDSPYRLERTIIQKLKNDILCKA